ncbi:MAG: NADP-dependent isocitrate dehydrogenase [Planctomycetota bacterium]|nr:NADP-dependent isocitrate dehydrogenase [Planctomycetota bacterium]MDW8372625.1 NADP-dependent isocitrate dehydrogenase [Planctomycetota bacterium]
MLDSAPVIHWTQTDEAPALATASLLPIVQAFCAAAGVRVEARDISLAHRILAAFALAPDHLAELAARCREPQAAIIKLPNISASVPQLMAAIAELRSQGFDLPPYPEQADSGEARALLARYQRVLGSAVNPVLREGNSDRRCPQSVKAAARRQPPKNAAWSADNRCRVFSMREGDWFASERSRTAPADDALSVRLHADDGEVIELKREIAVGAGDIVDAATLSVRALRACYEEALREARAQGLLFSLHLKATMMKVSDPVLFGHAISVLFADCWQQHQAVLARAGARPELGLAEIEARLSALPEGEGAAALAALRARLAELPLAMVNSAQGISNLHAPNDVIVDASMPALIRDGGRMWNAQGALQEALAVIPDRCYSGVYQAVIDDCRQHGALDPRVIGSVANVGLMAQQAEEYGSHDKTFIAPKAGTVRVIGRDGSEWFAHRVEAGDLWRCCLTRAAAIADWVRLAVQRARASGQPAVFWLNAARAHERELIAAVQGELARLDTAGLELRILPPVEACREALAAIRAGRDVIAVTGNVLRDYLTDLFPILEIGTSAKMLSIVPLMAGGGLYETGAGGTAPKQVQQFLAEGYLRWDSLGEFLALQAALEDLGRRQRHAGARLLAAALDRANARYLDENKGPARALGGLDNRGSHAWLARFWAEELARQSEDAAFAARFRPLAQALAARMSEIEQELIAAQGRAQDIGGYYHPDPVRLAAAMRPSATFNRLLASLV